MLWGLSPALDLLSEYEKVNTLFGKKTINILLIGSADGRHILKTMSALRRHSVDECEVNFFIMDLAMDLVARQLLLLTIALEPEDRLGIQEKARLWMEVYGNTLLRPVTAKYIMSKAVQLIHMVTNKDYQQKRLPLVDLDFIKYKEIDQLENIFKYWIRNRYSIAKIWDMKLRKTLGTRYDAMEGIFDWDYNMKLHEIEGRTRVCASEYKLWRKIGDNPMALFWGLSPALDLIAEVKKMKDVVIDSEINVLLIGSTDARHILKTISRLKRHSKDLKVNFFVLDSGEVLVRQMLLLTIALEPREKLGPLEKSRLWMEVYGNTFLRSSTAKYVIHKMYQIRLMTSDKGFLERRMPLMDLSLLRYSDLDYLDEVAKYYQNNKSYAISRAWDGLLRAELEAEYDYRFTHFDFDYCAKLARIPGGHRVCKSEYIHWRNTGIAFTWLETEYSVGNPTLAVGIGTSGDSLYSLGYWGDMESGPYYAFGTDSEEKPMLEVRNDVNVRRATDITERNLQRMFHELEHGSPPSELYSASIDLGLVMMKPGNVDVDREVVLDYEPDRTPEDYSAIPVPNCKVFFLPGNAMDIFPKKAKNKEFFDIIYVAQNFFKFLNAEIMSMIRPNGCLIVETRKFVIGLKEDPGSYGKEVRSKLKEFGWVEFKKYHFRKDDHALFKKSTSKHNSEDDGQKCEAAGITDEPNPKTMEEPGLSENIVEEGSEHSKTMEKQDLSENIIEEGSEHAKTMVGQDLSENIIEECSQLNLEDTKETSASTSEESEHSFTICPEYGSYINQDQDIKGDEIVTTKCDDDISITSLDENEFDPKEDSKKKMSWIIPEEKTKPHSLPSEGASVPVLQVENSGSKEE